MIHIGLDLDNTVVDYTVAAKKYAEDNGFKIPENLAHLREYLRALGDIEWQKAQAWLYTIGLNYATPVTGWNYFLQKVCGTEVELYIISHKTKFSPATPGNYNLHTHAMNWLENILKIDEIAQLKGVFFLPTREAKIQKLASLQLNFFVDDLVDVLIDSQFPTNIEKILFNSSSNSASFTCIANFFELAELIFNE